MWLLQYGGQKGADVTDDIIRAALVVEKNINRRSAGTNVEYLGAEQQWQVVERLGLLSTHD